MAAIDLSKSQERWLILGLGLMLVAVVLFLMNQEDESPTGLTSGQDAVRDEEVEAPARPTSRHELAPPVILPAEPPSTATESPNPSVSREPESDEEEVPEEPRLAADCLVLKTGTLIVHLGATRDHPRLSQTDERSSHYLLFLRPITGVDDRFHSRVVRLEAGANKIENLPCVTWEYWMVGHQNLESAVSIDPNSGAQVSIDLTVRRNHLLKITATAKDGSPVVNLRLAAFAPGDCNRFVEIGSIPAESGEIDLLMDTDLNNVAVLADGWEPIFLDRATNRKRVDMVKLKGEFYVDRWHYEIKFKEESRFVRGWVTSKDGNPIRGSQVVFAPGADRVTAIGAAARNRNTSAPTVEKRVVVGTCDVDGRFEIQVPAGMSGYLQARATGFESSDMMSISPRNAEGRIEFRLLRARRMVGMTEKAASLVDPRTGRLRRYRRYRQPDIKEWFGPLDDDLMKIAAARDGSFLIETAPLSRFGIGKYLDTGSTSASIVWSVESDHPAEAVFETN